MWLSVLGVCVAKGTGGVTKHARQAKAWLRAGITDPPALACCVHWLSSKASLTSKTEKLLF